MKDILQPILCNTKINSFKIDDLVGIHMLTNLLRNIVVCIRLKVHHSQTFFLFSPLPQNL